MPGRDAWGAAYFAARPGRAAGAPRPAAADGRLLDELARQAVKDRPPAAADLEPLLRAAAGMPAAPPAQGRPAGPGGLTRMLESAGYLRGGRSWLTARGFDEIGDRMLRDVMRGLGRSGGGQHPTRRPGHGAEASEATRPAGPGSDARDLDVARTVLNAVERAARAGAPPGPPVAVLPEDLEEREPLEDARAAVAYCLDLSSTMRTRLGRTTRIEAAKRALWCLYALNRRMFPADDVHVVGFASLAARVEPRDVPFLRTFDANDDQLHYTNYQAALRLARRLLRGGPPGGRRIVLITDGQPSACFADTGAQRDAIMAERPYASLYRPDAGALARAGAGRGIRIDAGTAGLVYLRYAHKRVDARVDARTMAEARACAAGGIGLDTVVVSDEPELLEYAGRMEAAVGGRTYHVGGDGMDRVVVADYLRGARKVFTKTRGA